MLCSLLDEGDINPKVLQLIGNEKIQVRKSGAWSQAGLLMESEDGAWFLGEQDWKHCVRRRGAWGRPRLAPAGLWVLTGLPALPVACDPRQVCKLSGALLAALSL